MTGHLGTIALATGLLAAACSGGGVVTDADDGDAKTTSISKTLAPDTTATTSLAAMSAPEAGTTTTGVPMTTTLDTTSEPRDPPLGAFTWTTSSGDATELPFGHVVALRDGFAIAETVVGASAATYHLWSSQDGVSWHRRPLPVDAPLPLLVSNDNGLWLTSNVDQERVWRSDDGEAWQEVDTTAIQGGRPTVQPYLDLDDEPLLDFSSHNIRDAFVSNGDVVVGRWGNGLVVSDEGSAFELVPAPWPDLHFPAVVEIVSSGGRFFAYVAGENLPEKTAIWVSDDGKTWTDVGPFPFYRDPFDDEAGAHGFEVVERDGSFLAQVGYFCGVGNLWRSTDGINWEFVGDSPDRDLACGATLQVADFGWVFVTDGGTNIPEPNVWVSTNGTVWEELDLDGLAIKGGDGSSPRGQLGVSVVGDTIFIQALAHDNRTLWVGRPEASPVVVWGEPEGGPALSWVRVDLPVGTDAMDAVQLSSFRGQFYLTDYFPGRAALTSSDGHSWDPVGAESRSDPIGWDSSNGQSWTQVQEGPFELFSLVGVENGFLAADSGGFLWFTADGATWERIASTPNLQGVLFELIPWRGQALARSEDGRTLVAATSAGFSPLPLSDAAPAPSEFSGSVDAGQAGIAYIVEFEEEGGPFELVYSPDGLNWHLGPLPDPTGVAYCCFFAMFGLAVGNDAVMVLEDSSDGSGLALWLGTPQAEPATATATDPPHTATVVLNGTGCSSTIPSHSAAGELGVEIRNRTDTGMALVMGTYHDGFGHADLVAYGRDISTRPGFIEALEIYEVGPQATRHVLFDHGPGRYFTTCLDSTSTMIVLDDLTVGR